MTDEMEASAGAQTIGHVHCPVELSMPTLPLRPMAWQSARSALEVVQSPHRTTRVELQENDRVTQQAAQASSPGPGHVDTTVSPNVSSSASQKNCKTYPTPCKMLYALDLAIAWRPPRSADDFTTPDRYETDCCHRCNLPGPSPTHNIRQVKIFA